VTTVSSEVSEKARKYQSTTLQAVARVGQIDVAAQIGVDDSTISRFMSDEKGMARALQILAAAGLKVVPSSMQCFPPRKVAILMELARDHLNTLETPEQLQWD
jgi:transcriptional regulator with XRE-family HTH domain